MVYHSLKAIMESKNKKLTPAELIKKHLNDRNHVITDEELQKVMVGVDSHSEPYKNVIAAADSNRETAKNEKQVTNEKNVANPYDSLDI